MLFRPKMCSECGAEFAPNSGRQARCDSCRRPSRGVAAFALPRGYAAPTDSVPAHGTAEQYAAAVALVAAAGARDEALRMIAQEERWYRREFPGAPVSAYLLTVRALRAFPGQLEALSAGE